MSYAVVSPVFNEAANLGRLARSLARQSRVPDTWVIVDTGSTDETPAIVNQLAAEHPWVSPRRLPIGSEAIRGRPIVRAFHAGLEAVPTTSEIIVKMDADISVEPDHFDRLNREFECDPQLGIASGVAYEQQPDGVWRQRHGTGLGVWGAARAYRRACLESILPLDERMGWDTLDLVAAALDGWHARVISDLHFLHHRPEGGRDRSRFSHWEDQGRAAHYMGYRISYLVLRALFRLASDRAALGLLWGYLQATIEREPRCAKSEVVAYIRREQGLARLPHRVREAVRRREPLDEISPSS